MHLEHEDHVAEILDEIVAVDLGGGDHDVPTLLGLDIKVLRAAIAITFGAAHAVTGQCAVIDDDIRKIVIVDIETLDEVRAEIDRLAALSEKLFSNISGSCNSCCWAEAMTGINARTAIIVT